MLKYGLCNRFLSMLFVASARSLFGADVSTGQNRDHAPVVKEPTPRPSCVGVWTYRANNDLLFYTSTSASTRTKNHQRNEHDSLSRCCRMVRASSLSSTRRLRSTRS